jgi:23S rRNA pseudouridine2605 synthase
MKSEKRAPPRKRGQVALNRALSKLGLLSRAQALGAIRAGRVRVNGRVATDPSVLVVPERARIAIDGVHRDQAPWRAILFHKPRGIVTTRSDPQGRPTVFDAIGDAGHGLVAVGRLDRATSGLLLLTNDTRLADWITDPVNRVARVYLVTVRGRVEPASQFRLANESEDEPDGAAVIVRKASGRESHLTVELREGRNRQVRRLFEEAGHEVTRLKRVRLGGLELQSLAPGLWREVSREEVASAFPGAPIASERSVQTRTRGTGR